jgi:hypothetical protein
MNSIKQVLTDGLALLKEKQELDRTAMIANLTKDCNRRFDEIMNKQDIEWDDFYGRFWSLQLDQFNYFKLGTIKPGDFFYWMICRHRELINDQPIYVGKQPIASTTPSTYHGHPSGQEDRRIGARRGWNETKKRWVHHDFVDFIDKYVFTSDDSDLQYESGDEIDESIENRIRDGINEIMPSQWGKFGRLN